MGAQTPFESFGLGQHTRAVLQELLGFEPGDLDELEEAGVIESPPVPDEPDDVEP